ncbi:TOTE conflict system archaeo-eukaryotic primase domain-containing protein [Streptomyces sp. NRRL S-920]|uniref:TOTE conflict system archaeo-eukaryotic primase domain-containing protein n=1 Tax=Streptomyces sp. NRRL S-920 TaxID=1463921 RepID=UPI003B63D7C9
MRGVEDWSDGNDPNELRMSQRRPAGERGARPAEDKQHTPEGAPRPTAMPGPRAVGRSRPHAGAPVLGAGGGLPCAGPSSGTVAKITLLRALFAGRDDVYARRWVSARTGRTGWSPAEADRATRPRTTRTGCLGRWPRRPSTATSIRPTAS